MVAGHSIKIASGIKIRSKDRSFIEFITVQQRDLIDIPRCLLMVYGDDTVNVSTVSLCLMHFDSG